MAIQRQISINPAHGTPRVEFDPDPRDARVFDQIFWTNNDTVAHWPGLLNSDDTIDATFFMPNQIAPNGDTSPTFAFSNPAADPIRYACSLHPDEKGEIKVTT